MPRTRVESVGQSDWTNDLHWVRTSKQTRGERTQAKLLDAAEKLYSEGGIDDTTVSDIALLAGCSKGAIYHHFSDKKAMTYAIIERLTAEFQTMTRVATDPRRWHGATIGDILRGYVEVAFDKRLQREHSVKAAIQIGLHDAEVQTHFEKLRMEADEGLYALIIERRSEITHENPELAVKYVLEQIGTTLRTRLLGQSLVTRFGDQTDAHFLRETVRCSCGYLGVALPDGI